MSAIDDDPAAAKFAGRGLTKREVEILARRIEGFTRAGVSLSEGFRRLAADAPSRGFRTYLIDAATALEAGETLENVLERSSERLPGYVRGLVAAGIRSGELAAILRDLAESERTEAKMRRRFLLDLAPPLLAMIATTAVLMFIMIFVVPDFETIIHELERQLQNPRNSIRREIWATELIFGVSRFIRSLAGSAMLALAFFSVSVLIVKEIVAGGRSIEDMISRIPLVRTFFRTSAMGRLCETLGLLVGSGVPVGEALELAEDCVRDRRIARGCLLAADRTSLGESFARATIESTLFPHGFQALLEWAEKRSALADVLRMLSEIFWIRARDRSEFIRAVSIIAAWLIAIFSFSLVYTGLFLPMYRMMRLLSY